MDLEPLCLQQVFGDVRRADQHAVERTGPVGVVSLEHSLQNTKHVSTDSTQFQI